MNNYENSTIDDDLDKLRESMEEDLDKLDESMMCSTIMDFNVGMLMNYRRKINLVSERGVF